MFFVGRQALLALLLVCFCVIQIRCQAQGPKILSSTYKLKTGLDAGLDLDIAEFELKFDQEFFKMEFNDCPAVPTNFPYCADPATLDNTTCGPCDYASRTNCGTVKRQNIWGNCTCNMAYCTGDYADWTEITDLSNFAYSPGPVATFNVTHFRFFIDEGQPHCNQSIQFRMAAHMGDPDIYIMDPTYGPSTIVSGKYQGFWPWISYRSMGDSVLVCPTDTSVGTTVHADYPHTWSPGTWWVFILANTELEYNLTTRVLPIGPAQAPQDMTWCSNFQTPANPTNYFCLENDKTYYWDPTEVARTDITPAALPGAQVAAFVAKVDANTPCPRRFGVSLADSDALAEALSISFNVPLPFPATTNHSDMIFEQDYQRKRLAVSFCPADITQPTYIYVTIQGAGQDLRLFSSSNPDRFYLTRFPDIGPTAEQYAYIRDEFYLICPTAPPGPNGRPELYPCGTRQSGYQCQAQNFANIWGIPPVVEHTPFWPSPNYATLYSPIAGLNQAPPQFENQLVYQPNYFGFVVILKATFWNGFEEVINQHFDPAYLDSCYPDFKHGTFVNSNFWAIQRPTASGGVTGSPMAPSCNYTLFKEVSDSINDLISQIAGATNSIELLYLQDQLSYQTIREPYVACLAKANTLVNETVVAQTTTAKSCVLPTSSSFLVDPCCRAQNNWKLQCAPRPVNVTRSTYKSNDQAIDSQCAQPSCSATFVNDFASAKTDGCGEAIPFFEQWFNNHTRWWVTCSDLIFGYQLKGKRCNVDSDCVTKYNVQNTSYFCEVKKPFNNAINPFHSYSYTAGLCIEPYDALLDQFIRCFIDQDPLIASVARSDLGASTDAELIAKIKAITSDDDCVSTHNLGMADWDKTQQITLQGTQRNTFASTGLCTNATLYGADVPILGRIDEPPGGFYEVPLTAVRFDVPIACGTTEVAYVFNMGATSAAACNMSLTCNIMGSDCDHLSPSDCTTACNSVTGACVVCPYGEHCIAPLNLTQGECTNAITSSQGFCQLADGSYVLTDQATCATMGSCTHPVWDSNLGDYRNATSPTECQAAGYCNDWPFDTIWGGACVFEPETYFRRQCRSRFRSVCPAPSGCLPGTPGCSGCVSDDIGCVVYPASANKTYCESTSLTASTTPASVNIGVFTGRWYDKARTEAACNAYGCGCVKSGSGQGLLRSYFIQSPPSNNSYCASLNEECKPYYTWTQARWLNATWRGNLQWVAPKVFPTYNWTTSSPDWVKMAHYISGLVDKLYVNLAVTQAQCRLNRVAPALEAISCACGVDPASQCLKTVATDIPIGIAQPCAGIELDVAIPPHSLHFDPMSVQPSGTCLDMTVNAVSRSSFGNLSPGQSLSTYFTHLSRAARKDSFEFKNGKGAFVGQVIGAGILVNITAPATNVTLCLDEGGFFLDSVLRTLNTKDYPVFDFARSSVEFDDVTPLGINVTVTAVGAFCGQVDISNGIYVPVVRATDYLTKRPPRLNAGEQAIFIIAATFYVLVIVYSCYHMFYIVKYPGMASPWLTPPFWLCALLAISSLVRALYFYLLGGQVIRSSNIGNMILVEVPTFIWFTATTLVVFLWISVTSTKKQKHVAVIFRRLFLISNGIIWGLLVLFIILFIVLKDKKKSRNEFCQGRLGFTIDRTPRRVLFICYQVFLAALALLISISFLFYGTRVYIARSQLKKSAPHKKGGTSRSDERNLLFVVISCSLSFAAHAVLLLVLALVDPGIAYLVVILVLVEVGPSLFVLWANPSPKERRITATSLSRGSRSTTSKTTSATHSSSHSFQPPSGSSLGSGSGSGSHD